MIRSAAVMVLIALTAPLSASAGRASLSAPQPASGSVQSLPAPAVNEAKRMWASVEQSNSAAELDYFIKRFPESAYAGLARVRLKGILLRQAALEAGPSKENGARRTRPEEARRTIRETRMRVCRRESISECRARVTGSPYRVAWGRCVFRPVVCR
jgi:hypothetical protein